MLEWLMHSRMVWCRGWDRATGVSVGLPWSAPLVPLHHAHTSNAAPVYRHPQRRPTRSHTS